MKEIMKKEYITKCRTAGAEGIVLLRNEGNVLPLTCEDTISVFGRCQLEYYKSGTGSGGSVNVEYTTDLISGLKQYEKININEELLDVYKGWLKEHPYDNGGGEWAGEPWHQQEMKLSGELVKKASEKSNKALFMIGRTAGEDQDNSGQAGSYYLTEEETENLKTVTKYFKHVIVLLNVANVIDMQWLQKDYAHSVKAVLYVWQGGVEGGNALADILTGNAVPSGKLPDTIAYRLEDYPSTADFGSRSQNLYREDIYVGYKYFETFCREKVMYPFGFGLSYTCFELSDLQSRYEQNENGINIHISVRVRNTGARYSGKEVVQIYAQKPQGRLGKPALELIGFQKTKELRAGECTELTFDIPLSRLASYDDSGQSGHKSCFILEKGYYQIFVGTSIRDLYLPENSNAGQCAGENCLIGENGLTVCADIVCERLREALTPAVHFTRMKPGEKKKSGEYELVYEAVPVRSAGLEEKIEKNLPRELIRDGDRKIKIQEIMHGNADIEEFVAQFTEEELAILVRGEGMCSPKVTAGTASAFGGVADKMAAYGIPAVCTADGPSGIRMDNGKKAMQMPIGTMLASTWNPSLAEDIYSCLGEEMLENKVDVLLGPGVNIHRNPLNGRNFEYFSEDAYLTGCFAAAAVRGLKRAGVAGTVKHFACNNQETWRNQVDSVVSERAARELYLKGFEMAVKEGKAESVMTSYNPLNGHWCASNYELCTQILRGEWGFQGIVMTDWWAKMNDPARGGAADMKNTAAMVRAQNDLYMVVTNGGAEDNSFEDNTLEALGQGKITKAELQRSAVNICRFILSVPAMKRKPEQRKGEGTGNEIFKPVRFIPGEEKAQFEITTGGRYKFIIKLRSCLSELAQSSCNIMLNDIPAATVQSNGTNGQWTLRKLDDIFLDIGTYTMKLQENKPGLEIAWIDLTK